MHFYEKFLRFLKRYSKTFTAIQMNMPEKNFKNLNTAYYIIHHTDIS